MRFAPLLGLTLTMLLVVPRTVQGLDAANEIRIATFRCDVTPPPDGHPLIWLTPVKEVETPLEARGLILDDGQRRFVLCAMDWCGICNGTYELFHTALARGAHTTPDRVALHTVHQHTAPYTDGDAQRYLDEVKSGIRYADFAFLDQVAERLAKAAEEATQRLEVVNQVGFAAVPVERVAATRRPQTPDGRIAVRYSSCKDPAIRELPEGTIDPLLRTVTFARHGKPLVRLHYYATHPQSFYGDPRASSDVPGFARSRLETEDGAFQIYFNGCGGDVTMGKYNDGSREARDELTQRLFTAMRNACTQTRYEPVKTIDFRCVEFFLIPRTDKGYTREELLARLENPNENPIQRVRTATGLTFLDRIRKPFLAQALYLNDAVIIHLPGECFVHYQLFAQSLRPNQFVAVAAYGDLAAQYVCTAVAYEEGGYEPTATFLAPENQTIVEDAIKQLLGAGK